jgi:hypothetical protein
MPVDLEINPVNQDHKIIVFNAITEYVYLTEQYLTTLRYGSDLNIEFSKKAKQLSYINLKNAVEAALPG